MNTYIYVAPTRGANDDDDDDGDGDDDDDDDDNRSGHICILLFKHTVTQ